MGISLKNVIFLLEKCFLFKKRCSFCFDLQVDSVNSASEAQA